MNRILIYTLLLIFWITPTAVAQQWTQDHIKEEGFGSDLVSFFHDEMKKEIGKEPPALAFIPVGEKETKTLESMKGEPAILMFWSTNCSGCKIQMESLNMLYSKYSARGLNFIYLSSEPASMLGDFQESNKLLGLVGHVEKSNMTRPFQLLATPSVYVIDSEGVVHDGWLRPKDLEALERRVEPLL